MRLFRFCFDVLSFAAPVYFPSILLAYGFVHFCVPGALHYPRKLDSVRCSANAKLW